MGVERLRELVHLIVQSWHRLTRHRGPHSARVLLRHCRSSLKLRLNVVIRLLKLHLCILLLWHIGNLIRLVRVRVSAWLVLPHHLLVILALIKYCLLHIKWSSLLLCLNDRHSRRITISLNLIVEWRLLIIPLRWNFGVVRHILTEIRLLLIA